MNEYSGTVKHKHKLNKTNEYVGAVVFCSSLTLVLTFVIVRIILAIRRLIHG